MSKILKIATSLADRVSDDKLPYQRLRWMAEYLEWQYGATKSEMTEAYFAAVNILKHKGIENSKRKPLTALTAKQRKVMRSQAKRLAIMLARFLETSVEVSRSPIQNYGSGIARIQIVVKNGMFLYPSFDDLALWDSLSELNQAIAVCKVAESNRVDFDYLKQFFSSLQ